MTQRDRDLAEYFAQHTTARMIEALQSDEVTDRVVEKWSGRIQRMVGSAVLRTVFMLLGVALLIGSIKFGAVDKLLDAFTIKGK